MSERRDLFIAAGLVHLKAEDPSRDRRILDVISNADRAIELSAGSTHHKLDAWWRSLSHTQKQVAYEHAHVKVGDLSSLAPASLDPIDNTPEHLLRQGYRSGKMP